MEGIVMYIDIDVNDAIKKLGCLKLLLGVFFSLVCFFWIFKKLRKGRNWLHLTMK